MSTHISQHGNRGCAESAAKLRAMFDLAPIAVAILDVQNRYECVNPAYCRLMGYRPEELLGKPASAAANEGPDAVSYTHLQRAYCRWFMTDEPKEGAFPAHMLMTVKD